MIVLSISVPGSEGKAGSASAAGGFNWYAATLSLIAFLAEASMMYGQVG